MIALYVIGHAYVAAVIATAGAIWVIGSAHGLRAALRAHAAYNTTPTPPALPPRHAEPRKWSTDNTGAPVLLWPHDN